MIRDDRIKILGSASVWSLEEIVLMADSCMPKPDKRGPGRNRTEESLG